MNKSLIIKIVAGSTMGVFCIGLKVANRRIKKQRNEIFAKLQEVANDYHDLINEYGEAAIQMQLLTAENKAQGCLIEILEQELNKDSKKSKKKRT